MDRVNTGDKGNGTRRLKFREGLMALWRIVSLYRENRERRSRLTAVDQERLAAYEALGLREGKRPEYLSLTERKSVIQAEQNVSAARDRQAAAKKLMEDCVFRVDAAQSLHEQALAEAHGRYRSVHERLCGGRADAEVRDQARKAARHVRDARRTWRAAYAGARAEGMALSRAVDEAARERAATEQDLAEARRLLGAAILAVGGIGHGDELSAKIRTLDTDSARLKAETAQTAETMRVLARAGRRTAILLAVLLAFLIGGTITYRAWRRASLQKKVEQIRRGLERSDREKTRTEKAAEQEIESDNLRIVE